MSKSIIGKPAAARRMNVMSPRTLATPERIAFVEKAAWNVEVDIGNMAKIKKHAAQKAQRKAEKKAKKK